MIYGTLQIESGNFLATYNYGTEWTDNDGREFVIVELINLHHEPQPHDDESQLDLDQLEEQARRLASDRLGMPY